MTSSALHTVPLTRHSATPSQAIHSILVRVHPVHEEALRLTFSLVGNLTQLCIPPPCVMRRADGLWQHTCFEAFIRVPGQPAYWEFNFSPSREWAAYAFRSYRDGVTMIEEELAPEISVYRSTDQFDLTVLIPLRRLSLPLSYSLLRLALSAVIEETSGVLSYWALTHPASKPDFHHPDTFVLEIELATNHEIRD